MNSRTIIDFLSYVELAGCMTALVLMHYRKQSAQYRALSLFLSTRVLGFCILLPLMRMSGRQLSVPVAYKLYFYVYWASYALEAIFSFFIIFGIYKLAMAPLQGLQRLGMLMFRWAAGIAIAIAITMAMGPHVTSNSFIVNATSQLQETQSVITLCMLLFVCLAIRPMGLSYRSKIFGVCLGLGVSATTDLVCSSWIAHFSKIYSTLGVVSGISICVTLVIWSVYFAIPEPKRRMIILPTTSPFLRWNQISLALGDEPGFVAIGNVSPEMFAPAEVEVMRRASLKMRPAAAN